MLASSFYKSYAISRMGIAIEAESIGVEVDTSDMSEQQFEIFLRDLERGPETVSLRALKIALQHKGPFEEEAPSPFVKVEPLIY